MSVSGAAPAAAVVNPPVVPPVTPAPAAPAVVPAAPVVPAANPTPAAPAAPAEPAAVTPPPATNPPGQPPVDSTKPAAGATAPVVYDLKLPGGSLLKPDHLADTVAFAKANNLAPDQAQALLDRESQVVAAFQTQELAEFKERASQWVGEVISDKEIGGSQELAGKSVELARRVLTKHAPPEFLKLLDDTGYGNHPALVKTLVRLAKASGDDSLVLPNNHGAPEAKSVVDKFYPKKE